MSNKSVITLRVASELKQRLAQLADREGVSMNQLISYFLTESVTAMEMRHRVEARFKQIEGKTTEELQAAALAVFENLRERQSEREGEIEIPDWDRWPEEDEKRRNEKVASKPIKAGMSRSQLYQQSSQQSYSVHEPNPEYNPDLDS